MNFLIHLHYLRVFVIRIMVVLGLNNYLAKYLLQLTPLCPPLNWRCVGVEIIRSAQQTKLSNLQTSNYAYRICVYSLQRHKINVVPLSTRPTPPDGRSPGRCFSIASAVKPGKPSPRLCRALEFSAIQRHVTWRLKFCILAHCCLESQRYFFSDCIFIHWILVQNVNFKTFNNTPTCFDHYSDHLQGTSRFLVNVTEYKIVNVQLWWWGRITVN